MKECGERKWRLGNNQACLVSVAINRYPLVKFISLWKTGSTKKILVMFSRRYLGSLSWYSANVSGMIAFWNHNLLNSDYIPCEVHVIVKYLVWNRNYQQTETDVNGIRQWFFDVGWTNTLATLSPFSINIFRDQEVYPTSFSPKWFHYLELWPRKF